jgi:uncharacterized protein YbjT (DUF2867 family)
MKFVVTGSAGNVSRPLSELLLAGGHEVTVVGRSAGNLAELVALGATAAVGDLYDADFLEHAFRGADGVYLMLPPSAGADSIKRASTDIARGFAAALKGSGVRKAVFLSSYGAHRLDDAGAISGMGLAEGVLSELPGVDVLSLRAGYFYTNLLLAIEELKTSGVLGNMFEVPAGAFTVVDPDDIARAAADALIAGSFTGHSYQYVVSDETGTDEIAELIGEEIGVRGLKWTRFGADDVRGTLVGYGFAEGAADDYVEMFTALDKGLLFEDYVTNKPELGKVSIEEFAKKFAAAYQS